MSHVEDFLNKKEEQSIIDAIIKAENQTSGEIRVHLENTSENFCMERAKEVFFMLNMHNTKNKNGVLFYVAVDDHQFAIIGDEGIDSVVPDDFWESIKERVLSEFKKGNFADGLVLGIIEAGQKLREYFPYNREDNDELTNEISKGRIQ